MTPAGAAPDPSRTLAILFGASRWPDFDGLDDAQAGLTYAAAADEFRGYLLSETGFGLPKDNLLDLFDSNDGMVAQDKRIHDFIIRKCKETATIQDLIVMYIGHGSTMQDNKFIFILKSTNRDQREITAYKSESLGRTLKKSAPRLRKWIILDCCAAQAAYGDFQPASEPQTVLESEALDAFPPDGAAFYAACSSNNFAYNDTATGSRMFTAALTGVLRKGDTTLSEHLTLSEVALLTLAEINRRHGPDAVRPYIGDPDQRKGELSRLPFFPNPARRKIGVEAQLAALQESVSALQRHFDQRLDEANKALDEQKAQHEAFVRRVNEQGASGGDIAGVRKVHRGLDGGPAGLEGLTVDEQRWWDRARGGYFLSGYILYGSAWLLLSALFLLALPSFIQRSPNTDQILRTVGAVLTVAGALTAFIAAFGARDNGPASIVEPRSPELEALLRSNSSFRRIYCAEYQQTFLGLLSRRAMALALLMSVVVVFLGALPLIDKLWTS